MLRTLITRHLAPRLIAWAAQRRPDVCIPRKESPYLKRWFILPRNPVFNIYLHQFLRSDDDRALHDHPWVNLSILLKGRYVECTIPAGGSHVRTTRRAGDMALRRSGSAHRIELIPEIVRGPDGPTSRPAPCWTLFITGPRIREWGFHCRKGWRHWKDFTSADGRDVGRGCGEDATSPAFALPAGLRGVVWWGLAVAASALTLGASLAAWVLA